MRAIWLGCLAASGLTVIAVMAQVPKSGESSSDVPDILLDGLNRGAVLEQYVARILGMLRQADMKGDGLDREDILLSQKKKVAEARASSIQHYLRFDLNGDFKTTLEEMLQNQPPNIESRNDYIESVLQRVDTNGDDVITLVEAADAANEYVTDPLGELMTLDPNGDGRLTARELRERTEQTFRRFDTDGDERISESEHTRIPVRRPRIHVRPASKRCTLPDVPNKAKLVMVGLYESQAVASSVIGGQDRETNIVDLFIEPGASPLYLALTSYESMIWRITGATDRLTHVAIAATTSADRSRAAPGTTPRLIPATPQYTRAISASGVLGVAEPKTTILPSECLTYFKAADSSEAERAAAMLSQLTKRAPDFVVGAYSVQKIEVPSGKMVSLPRSMVPGRLSGPPVPLGFDAETWKSAIRFWPGGVIQVDHRKVIAKASVEPYKVLPSQMGLAQLIGSGAIERVSRDTFRVVRPIPHMPPSMGGAHSVTLRFAKGVPLPPGDPGHSCIITEADGVSRGARCRLERDVSPVP
jgi:Ca2+-binding EF-hand superfamily protein